MSDDNEFEPLQPREARVVWVVVGLACAGWIAAAVVGLVAVIWGK